MKFEFNHNSGENMTREEVKSKLQEISKDLNNAISLLSSKNSSVKELLDKIYNLHLRLVNLHEAAIAVYKENPKLRRIHKTLYEEVMKNISRYGNFSEIESEI